MWKTFKDIDTKKSENQIEHMREQQSYIFVRKDNIMIQHFIKNKTYWLANCIINYICLVDSSAIVWCVLYLQSLY